MSDSLFIIIAFIIALTIGIYLGKMLFSANSKSEKASLEEKTNGLLSQINQLKEQFQNERNQFEKQLFALNAEKETIRSEKEAFAIQLSKKETDFENLWERNKEQKEEVEKLQEKFTKEFENLANKILEEKTSNLPNKTKKTSKIFFRHCKIKFNFLKRK
jgi:DNA recombination protein RmuC